MIAPEAMHYDTLVTQANAAIASRYEGQIALLAPHLVPRHGTLERIAIFLASSTYLLPLGMLPLIAAAWARDIRIIMRLFAMPFTSLLLMRLLATAPSERLESVLRSNSFPPCATTGQVPRGIDEPVEPQELPLDDFANEQALDDK